MSNICTRFIFKPLIINIYCLLQVCLIKKKWWTDLRLLCILFWSLTTLLCSYAPLETELQIGIYITHRKNPNLLFNYCALEPLKKKNREAKRFKFHQEKYWLLYSLFQSSSTVHIILLSDYCVLVHLWNREAKVCIHF